MTQDKTSTRRSFLQGGALVAAPMAAASISAVALADQDLKSRIARLEDEAAIRDVHQSWLRQVNAAEHGGLAGGAVRRIVAHPAGAPDQIRIAPDGRSATGHFDCAVERDVPLAQDSTLAQMAHAQGDGSLRSTERRTLTVKYIKDRDAWRIASVELSR
ncbi:MAG TPA: hypothetical protein VMU40_02375 [Steroidobacteraceae bacterium]|nr:hypothetical protein [Steroidobacteraceae bacterium]